MLYIIINWLCVLLITLPIGNFTLYLFHKDAQQEKSIFLYLILGFFSISFLAHIWCFFFPINLLFLTLIVITSLFLMLKNNFWHKFKDNLLSISGYQFILFFSFLFILAAYSAMPSKLADDGLYYVQTSKWLESYGFVKGLGNIHITLGYTSTWHILTSIFSFSFIPKINFNDLNGLLLLVYLMDKILSKEKNIFHFILPFTILFSVMFLSAPSPDLPIILISIYVFEKVYFYNWHLKYAEIILIICLFSFSIKITAILLIFIGLFTLFYFIKKNSIFNITTIVLLIFCVLIFTKNIFQTGYILFPTHYFNLFNFDWKVPLGILNEFWVGVKTWGILETLDGKEITQIHNLDFFSQFKLWITQSGYKGIVNKFIFILSVVFVCYFLLQIIYKKVNFKQGLLCFFIFSSMILWYYSAPQMRFVLGMLLIMLGVILNNNSNSKIYTFALKYNLIIIILILLIPISIPFKLLNDSSANKSITQFEPLKSEYVVKPFLKYDFEKIDSFSFSEMNFYHYDKVYYCWDCKLPCTNAAYLKYFLVKYKFKIEMINKNDIGKGFRTIKYD